MSQIGMRKNYKKRSGWNSKNIFEEVDVLNARRKKKLLNLKNIG